MDLYISLEMDLYLKLNYGLLLISYLLYLIMFIILAELEVFTKSPFFLFGGSFEILGVRFDNPSLFNGLSIFFFFNSFISTLNFSVISPIFGRMMYASENDPVLPSGISKMNLYIILSLYNVWSSLRSLFNLLGILSNISFFLATTFGFLIGDALIKYMYINHPGVLQFHTKTAKVESESKPILAQRHQHLDRSWMF